MCVCVCTAGFPADVVSALCLVWAPHDFGPILGADSGWIRGQSGFNLGVVRGSSSHLVPQRSPTPQPFRLSPSLR